MINFLLSISSSIDSRVLKAHKEKLNIYIRPDSSVRQAVKSVDESLN